MLRTVLLISELRFCCGLSILCERMKRWFGFALFPAVGVALTLAAVYLLHSATLRIPADGSVQRALFITGDILLGVFVLVGAIYGSVRLAIYFFDNNESGSKGDQEVRR